MIVHQLNYSHGMANQDALVQLLLLDEVLHILGHNTIGMFWGMKRLTMVAQILRSYISIQNFAFLVTL